MFFKGTARRGVGAIARETKSAGGYLNASTTYDHTTYFTVLPAAGLEAALDIQSDALRNSRHRCRRAGPRAAGHHPGGQAQARHAVRGGLRDAARGDVRPAPHPAVADRARGAARPADPRRSLGLLPLALRAGAHHRRRSSARWIPTARSALARAGLRRLGRGAGRGRSLARGARAPRGARPHPPRRREPGRAGAGLARGAAAASRRAGARSRRRGARLGAGELALSRAARAGHRDLGGRAQLRADRAGRLQRERRARARSGWTRRSRASPRRSRGSRWSGPSTEELERARTLVRARWARRLESMEGRASALAAAEALEDVGLLDREYARARRDRPGARCARPPRATSLPDAVAASSYLPAERRTRPHRRRAGPRLRGHRAAARLANGGASGRGVPPAGGPLARGRARRVRSPGSPGADLLVYRKTGVPAGHPRRSTCRAAGSIRRPRRGSARCWCARAVRGAGDLDAAALAFAFERLGGTLATSSASDWLGFGASVLAEHLAEAAALLDARLHASRGSHDADVTAERGLMVAEAERVADDMFRYPVPARVLRGVRRPGLRAAGGRSARDAAGHRAGRRARAGTAARCCGARPVVIAVGDVDPDARVGRPGRRLRARGRALSPRRRWPSRCDWLPGRRRTPPVRVVSRDKAQAALAMVFPGPSRRQPEHAAAQVWARSRAGSAGGCSRRCGTGARWPTPSMASAWQKARGGALLTYIATSPEREEEAREQMLVGAGALHAGAGGARRSCGRR